MSKFVGFLKKHWLALIVCILIVLFAVVGVPMIINWAFSSGFLALQWGPDDALAYYGSALGFIGTVLTAVATGVVYVIGAVASVFLALWGGIEALIMLFL